MKKITFIIALLVQTSFAFATDKNAVVATARYDNTKMYRQPGTSTEILKSLKSTDEVVVVRKYNKDWTIVMINDAVGYVLTSELAKPKKQASTAWAKR